MSFVSSFFTAQTFSAHLQTIKRALQICLTQNEIAKLLVIIRLRAMWCNKLFNMHVVYTAVSLLESMHNYENVMLHNKHIEDTATQFISKLVWSLKCSWWLFTVLYLISTLICLSVRGDKRHAKLKWESQDGQQIGKLLTHLKFRATLRVKLPKKSLLNRL